MGTPKKHSGRENIIIKEPKTFPELKNINLQTDKGQHREILEHNGLRKYPKNL